MPTTILHITTADGQADAFAAYPDTGGPVPGVLMYPDGFGIRPTVRRMATELAGHGYHVVVPNIFYRHGPTPVVELPEYIGAEDRPAIFEQIMPMVKGHTVEQTRRDADAFLSVFDGPVAVTGYCIGGLLAVRTAAAFPDRVHAVAGFHARVGADGPETLAAITARIHFGHAEGDLTPGELAALNQTLDAAGLDYTSEIYPGTVHGFTMSDTDAFDPDGLRQHWDRLLSLLRG